MERRTRIASGLLSLALACALVCPPAAPAAEKAPKKAAAKTAEVKAAAAKDAATTTPPSKEEMMAAMMKMANPGPEHAALNPLVGTWKTTTKSWMDPAAPPEVSEGTCERNWMMNGRYLVGSYKGNFGGMPFEGMEVLGFDNTKKEYVSSWMDNMGTGIMLSRGGAMDASTKTITLAGTATDPTGKDFAMRNITNIVDGNTYVMTMWCNLTGQDQKMMEVTYTRVK